MKINVISRTATANRARAIVPRQIALIYTDRISRLDECRHLSDNDPIASYVKLRILGELIHPANIIKHYRLVNPIIINNN